MSHDGYRLWINKDRTLFVRLWDDGTMEVATRAKPWDTWGPPIDLKEEPQ